MALDQTQISQLYVAIFNRASEGEGNTYWRTHPDLGSMDAVAGAMLDTTDAKTYFGSSLDTNQAFIEHIYLNTLNKTSAQDAEGIAYWTGLLNSGMSRGDVVARLVSVIKDYAPDAPSYDPDDIATVIAYNQFANRVAVSNYMADKVYDTPDDYARTTAFDKDLRVTDDTATVTAARQRIDDMAATSGSGTLISIDTGTLEAPVSLDAGEDAFVFTDDASVLTHVIIDNFTADDRITLTNARPGDYSFSNDGEDLYIIFNNQGTVNHISLTGVVAGDALVYDQTSFISAMGFDPFGS
jgi:hypothetical protein